MSLLLAVLITVSSGIEFKKDTLSNGMVVVACRKPGLPIFHIETGIKAGSFYDRVGGEAYITSHLLDNGTENLTQHEIAVKIDELGGNFDVYTYRSYSGISFTVIDENREEAVKLIADLLMHPVFPEKEFEQEKSRVIQDLKRMNSQPEDVSRNLFLRELYGDNPPGRPAMGTLETVEKITLDDVKKFYNEHYVPENVYMVVVSDMDPAEAIELVRKYFEQWEKRSEATPPEFEVKFPEKGYIKIHHMETNQSYIVMGHRGVRRDNPDWVKLQLFNYGFGGGGFSSRLLDEVRDKKGYTYYAYSYFTWGYDYPGIFMMGTFTKLENTQEVIDIMKSLLENTRENGITAQELEGAIKYYEGSLPRRVETYEGLAKRILDGLIYNLPDFYWEKEAEEMRKVKVEEVNEILPKYLHPEELVIVVVTDTTKCKLNLKGDEK